MKITGTSARPGCAFSRRQVSNPSMPGITASISTRSGVSSSRDPQRRRAVERHQRGDARLIEGVGEERSVSAEVIDDEHDVAQGDRFRHRSRPPRCVRVPPGSGEVELSARPRRWRDGVGTGGTA